VLEDVGRDERSRWLELVFDWLIAWLDLIEEAKEERIIVSNRGHHDRHRSRHRHSSPHLEFVLLTIDFIRSSLDGVLEDPYRPHALRVVDADA